MASPLYSILDAGSYSHATKPLLKDFIPVGRGEDWNAADREKFRRMLYNKRIVVIQLLARLGVESGMSRTHEGADARDEYEIYIKSGTYEDTVNIWDDIRAIIVGTTSSTVYNRIEFDNASYGPQPGRFDAVLRVNAYRGGLAI